MPGSTQVPIRLRLTFAYGTLTLFGRLSHTFLLTIGFLTPLRRALQPPRSSRSLGLGSFPFARHYSGNYFFSSGYLDVSVPQVPLLYPIYTDKGSHRFAVGGFPIRTSPDQRLYTATRGFSQCPTSFVGIWRLGIHHKPLLAYLPSTESSIVFSLSSFFLFLLCAFCASLACDASLIRLLRCGLAVLSIETRQPGIPPGCAAYGIANQCFRLSDFRSTS